MATAVTYRTTEGAGKLRTVILDQVRQSVVVLPSGRLEVLLGKQLHGTTCAHELWDSALATCGDDFIVPARQVVQQREMAVAVRVKTHKRVVASA